MGVLHMPTAAGHHPLKSCPRHEAPPQIILKSVTFTMTTESLGSDVADRVCELCRAVQSMSKCASYVILCFVCSQRPSVHGR